MATGTATKSDRVTRDQDYDKFISQQIERTRRQVQVTELVTLVLTLCVGILAFLFTMTLVDHWVVDLGFVGRLIGLVVLIVGTISYIAVKILPFLIRSINPVYAAREIEKSSPQVKNGLINFLLLRHRRNEVRPAIFEAVQKRAAIELSNVDVATTIDRTAVIRLGYALAALVALFGVYKIVSPKDPVATLARVAAPWKPIARPSRVEIENVSPGNTTVYRGQKVTIKATIFGLSEEHVPHVVYSTADGRIADAQIPMVPESDNGYQCLIGGESGLQFLTTYRVVAGDAESESFQIVVKESPSIEVTRVDYQFPRYTELPPESSNTGDIRAIEGTQVTVYAESNQPISSAYIELVPSKSSGDASSSNQPTHFRVLAMKHQGQTAKTSFILKMLADRTTPEFAAYRVRFSNEQGEKNQEPVVHPIDVTPDLEPLIDILDPAARDSQVPQNGFLDIQVRAVDPDFQLSSVKVNGAVSGNNVLGVELIDRPERGQVVRTFRLHPNEMKLNVGDALFVWATAADNRHDPVSRNPEPNLVRTENYRIRIVAPTPPSENNRDSQQNPQSNGPSDSNNEDAQAEESRSDSEKSGSNNSSSSSTQDSSTSQSEDATGTSAEGSTDTSESNSKSLDGSSQADQSDRSDESPSSSGTQGNSNGQSSDNDQNNQSENQPSDSSSATGDPSDDASNQQPVASDGSNDPDAFERILDHMQNEEKPQETQSDNSNSSVDENGVDENSVDENSADNKNENDSERDDSDDASSGQGTDTDDKNNGEPATPGEKQKSSETGEPTPNNNGSSTSDDSQDSGDEAGSSKGTEQEGNGHDKNDARGQQNSASDTDSNQQKNSPTADNDRDGTNPKTPSDRQNDTGTDPQRSKPNEDSTGNNSPTRSQGENSDNSDDSNASDDETPGDPANSSDDSNAIPADQDKPPQNGQTRDDHQKGATDDGTSEDVGTEKPSNSANDSTGEPSSNADSKRNGEPPAEKNASPSGQNPSDLKPDQQMNRDGSYSKPSDQPRNGAKADKADEANLEYAQKATDMALEYLENHRNDRGLLDKLGWTEEDAAAFLKRWRELKSQSAGDKRSARNRSEWLDALKSLGLKPKQNSVRSGASRIRDKRSVASDSGQRPQPPTSYADQFRAYLKEAQKSSGE